MAGISLAVSAFNATYRLWPQAEPDQAVVAATLIAVEILWVSAVIPLFVSALIGSFLLLPLADDPGLDVKSMAILIAIAVSLDFMMPVGTPPSAIAYSTGMVKVRQMIVNGFLVNIGTGLILALLYFFVYL